MQTHSGLWVQSSLRAAWEPGALLIEGWRKCCPSSGRAWTPRCLSDPLGPSGDWLVPSSEKGHPYSIRWPLPEPLTDAPRSSLTSIWLSVSRVRSACEMNHRGPRVTSAVSLDSVVSCHTVGVRAAGEWHQLWGPAGWEQGQESPHLEQHHCPRPRCYFT